MKYYDKIFLLVSLAALGASLGYYFMNEPELAKKDAKVSSLLSQKAEGVKWSDIVVPKLDLTPMEWPEVKAQDPEGRWFFQVFTAPQIWVDNDGKFITESPYIKARAMQSFSLKYGGVSNEPYPIKYVGFMGSPDNPRIQLRNDVDKTFFTGKLNTPVTMQVMSEGKAKTIDVGLVIKSFESKRVKKADNTISDIVTVTLFDKKYGKEIKIYSNKPTVIEDSRRLSLVLPDGAEWFVVKAGESKQVGEALYTVKSVDFDGGSAVVEMVPTDKNLPSQTMKLSDKGVEPVKTSKK
jgi:hypothetical protein